MRIFVRLMIAIAVLGACFAAYRVWLQIYKKPKEFSIQLREVGRALDLYFQDCKDFPSAHQGLSALISRPQVSPQCEEWDGPYIPQESIHDPWGRPLLYERDGAYYNLKSLGQDGLPGGTDQDTDISLEEL